MRDEPDLSDLAFDVERHREAFNAFAALNLSAVSVKPALRARNKALVEYPDSLFHISRLQRDKAIDVSEVIFDGDDESEAETVRADVERYFRRHFPGRYQIEASIADSGEAAGATVYFRSRAQTV